MGWRGAWANEEIAAHRVNGSERGKRVGAERVGIPFALDGIHRVAASV